MIRNSGNTASRRRHQVCTKTAGYKLPLRFNAWNSVNGNTTSGRRNYVWLRTEMWFRVHQRQTQLQSIAWGIALCREDAHGVHIIRQPFLLRAKKSSKRKKDCITSDEELTSTTTWQITWPSVFCSIDQGMPEAFCNITWLACSRNNDTTEYEDQRTIFKNANIRTQEVARLMQRSTSTLSCGCRHQCTVLFYFNTMCLDSIPQAGAFEFWQRLEFSHCQHRKWKAPLRLHKNCMIHV